MNSSISSAWWFFAAGLLLPGCSSAPITFRVWPEEAPVAGSPADYPDHWAGVDRPGTGDVKVGLAFSGGGTFSATASVGALRGLKHLGLLNRVDYVSGVSGGAWGVLPYVFLDWEQARKVEKLRMIGSQAALEDRYLGRYVAPGQMRLCDLEATEPGSVVSLVSDTAFSLPLFDLQGDENFAHMLNHTFLVPLGIGDDRRYVCGSEEQLADILSRNPSLSREDFYLPGPGKPFLISNMALERKRRVDPLHKIVASLSSRISLSEGYYPAEATPVYTGLVAPSHPKRGVIGLLETPVGGFVETFGFDAGFREWATPNDTAIGAHRTEGVFTRRRPAFSLADMMAGTGSAPTAILGALVDPLGLRPEFTLFAGWEADPARHSREQPMVDGGSCDNTGIAALLSHGATHIVAFINAGPVYEAEPKKRGHGAESKLTTSISCLFGKVGIEGREGLAAWRTFALANPETNHLLDDDGGRLQELEGAFDRLSREGKPLVYVADYRTSQYRASLDRYGVEAGRPVRICWVYLTATERDPASRDRDPWLSKLSCNTRHLMENGNGLRRFPAMGVYFANPPYIQQMSVLQANALAHYSAHNVVAGESAIRRAFSK